MTDLTTTNRREPLSNRPSSRKSLSLSTPRGLQLREEPRKSTEPFRFPISYTYDLKPVVTSQRQLLNYVINIDGEIEQTIKRTGSKIQVRYIMVLQAVKDLKIELEKAQRRYQKLYEELNNSPNIVNYQRENEFAKSFCLYLETAQTKIHDNINMTKSKTNNDKQKYFQKKELLKAKWHENLALIAKIHQIKMTVNMQRLRTNPRSRSVLRGTSTPHRFVIYSPTFEVNRVKRAKIISSEISTNHQRAKRLVTESTSIRTEGVHNLSALGQYSVNSSTIFIDEATILKREIKDLQIENQKAKLRIFAKCSEFIEFSKLFAGCFDAVEKYFKKAQSVSVSSGLQGTLLFTLMDEDNKKQVSELGPSMMTMENFRRHSNKAFAKEAEMGSKNVVYSALKKMIKVANYSNREQRLGKIMPHIDPESLRRFAPAQVVGILTMKLKARKEFRAFFIAKSKAVAWIATEVKTMSKF